MAALLTHRDLLLLQSFIERQLSNIESVGLSVETDDDMAAYKKAIEGAEGAHGIQGLNDPEASYVTPENSYWVKLLDRRGDIVGVNAQRCMIVRRFVDEFDAGGMFSNRKPILDYSMPGLAAEACRIPDLSGSMVIGGGMWIDKAWRGHHLYKSFSPLVQALSLRHFKYDWYGAFYRQTDKHLGLAKEGAGFNNLELLVDGLWPPYGREMKIYLAWKSREEFLDCAAEQVYGWHRGLN